MDTMDKDNNSYNKIMVKIIKKLWYNCKVCEGCDSIVYVDDALCSVCRAYRFDESKLAVHTAADKILTDKDATFQHTGFFSTVYSGLSSLT